MGAWLSASVISLGETSDSTFCLLKAAFRRNTFLVLSLVVTCDLVFDEPCGTVGVGDRASTVRVGGAELVELAEGRRSEMFDDDRFAAIRGSPAGRTTSLDEDLETRGRRGVV
jgi:hypothetical protein